MTARELQIFDLEYSMKLVPDYSFHSITDIAPDFFAKHGITFVMLDVDNTIAPYKQDAPEYEVIAWVEEVKQNGTELYIVSNSKRPNRVERFANALSLPYIKAAKKPSTRVTKALLNEKNLSPEKAALIGDQIYTDAWGANFTGCVSIVLYPIKFTNIFLALRYFAELPFRAFCKNKIHKES